MKIGLTLMPDDEVPPFAPAIAWIRETDHSRSWVAAATIFHTFISGPMPNDRLTAVVLRRKVGVTDVPYAFLVLGYGNEIFQVILPAPIEDAVLQGKTFNMVPFPTPGGPDPGTYGRPRTRGIDMTGKEVVRGEVTQLAMRYEIGIERDPGSKTSEK